MTNKKMIIAVPKGRVMKEILEILEKINIFPLKENFFYKDCRHLISDTNDINYQMIKVRNADIPTLLSIGAADIGFLGSDVILENDTHNIYSPLALNIGKCRISLAKKKDNNISLDDFLTNKKDIRIATKYPMISKKYFQKDLFSVDYIKLNGSMELAPLIGICDYIIDLVSTGDTLKQNNMEEVQVIKDIETFLVVSKISYKTNNSKIKELITKIHNVI